MASDLSAIVFDLDDTLYPEREYAFSGYEAVASAFGDVLKGLFDAARRLRQLFDTPDRGRVFNVVLAELNVADPEPIVRRMIETFRNHKPRINLHPDADAALARFRPRYKLGVISDGYSTAQHAKIEALSIRSRVDEIIVTDDWGREFWKPHPRAFEEIARRLKVTPPNCAYVSDNPAKDFIAPNALGWKTVFVNRPDGVHTQNAPPQGGEPQRTIATLDEL
ncbi:MAG: HAD family hydrolase [Planctomycetes bacterium]|nr:HAD family hydrolase [Planctomycetota bacterium]